ncbi:hypothetical protein C1645_841911, partial [Glomus cerebriforme]
TNYENQIYEDENFSNYEDQSFYSYEGDQSFLDYEDNQSFLSHNDQNYENILEELELEVNANYLNQVYADLITLITKHNLSNVTVKLA